MQHRLRHLVNCSILFSELPLLERPAAARAAGFDAVEFWWPFATPEPPDAEVDRFVSAVQDAGVQLVALNFAAGDMGSGDRGLLSLPGRAEDFRASVDVAVAIAGRLGTTAFNALYGNRAEDASPAQQDDLAVENLAVAAAAAARVGAVVLLEPVSGAPRYPLLTAQDAVAVIERVERDVGADNVRLLADLYHLSVNGDDVDAVVARHTDRIGHVQIADAPGRHEPGTGTLDLDRHLSALQTHGYAGWVSLEYVPTTTTLAGLDWLPLERRAAGSPPPC
jgi:hydroxypyruvate isomerase